MGVSRRRRPKRTLKVAVTIFLGASVVLTTFVGYETLYCGSPVYLPIYIAPWSRAPLAGELGGPDLEQRLRDRVLQQLETRVAVDETVGAVLGVPCRLARDDESATFDVVINAPGPSLVCLKIAPGELPGAAGHARVGSTQLAYKLVARPLIWWMDRPPRGSPEVPEIDTIIQVGSMHSDDVGEQGKADKDKKRHKWWWDLDEQEVVISGTVLLHGPGPNNHNNHHHAPSTLKQGTLSFEAVKSLHSNNEIGLKFKRTVLTYKDEHGREIQQRLC